MKRILTKAFFVVVLTIINLSANDNISRSLHSTSISQIRNSSKVINKNVLQDVQRRALISAGKSLNINTSLFDKKKKFSLYLKISSKSKFGFKYKF